MMSFSLPETRCVNDNQFPKNVGIVAMDVYFPSQFVDQAALEQFDGASTGKYTIGLGQDRMAFCSDREDINSICLSAVHNLMTKYQVPYNAIGRLEVGTETIVDKSKSVKSVLMQLFAESGNADVEGIDTTNACYGGTNALFNAIHWIESSAWDGRFALVVAGDIAVYATGAARPTGGAGAVAMLLGPNAPIILERGLRATHMEHVWDFYKPDLSSEYPEVDGKLSLQCYFRALDNCYARYLSKLKERETICGNVDTFDYMLFHSPFTKQVQKSFARLYFNDFVRHRDDPKFSGIDASLNNASLQDPFDKTLETPFMDLSKESFAKRVVPSLLLPKELGNSYCGSLYTSLCSLIFNRGDELIGKRISMFSYGSGLAASFFSLRVIGSVSHMQGHLNLSKRLACRQCVPADEFDRVMKLREETHNQKNYSPVSDESILFPATFYIDHIDEKFRRQYICKPLVQ